jgi:cobyrinic acid a,c-diamide synthase
MHSLDRLATTRRFRVRTAFEIPRIVIAGASSNVGKTTVAAGLIAALRRQGLIVQPFKCGPDYVDPSYHERAAGRPCRNLDTWMLSDSQLLESFARASRDADIAVVEGVMGVLDGSDWHEERGSTAQIAKLLNAPVLLVFDISGSARSAAAGVLGYQHFDPDVAIRGVVLNFAGSERHARGCAEAIERTTTLPTMGWLPRDLQLQIPERHLGLVPGGEQVDSDALITQMANAVNARFDVARIVGTARAAVQASVRPPESSVIADARDPASRPAIAVACDPAPHPVIAAARGGAPRPVIAVARDEAFCFYYPENLELLAEEGAAIEFFSPLRGERPSPNAAGVYLGGGYPELHGPALASNMGLWAALKDMHAAAAPIYAECGGLMVLTEGLTDSGGHTWSMCGLLPGFARMSGKLAALGYRHATALRGNLLADRGDSLRGHEFRYSSWVRETDVADDTAAWHVRGTRGDKQEADVGYARGNLLASYLHVHFGQRRDLATRFVQRLTRTDRTW